MDWKRFSFIFLIIVVLFGVVVLVGHTKSSPIIIITSMLATHNRCCNPSYARRIIGCLLRTIWCCKYRY